MNARVGGDGCATLKGGTKGSAPPSLFSPVQTESPLLREPLRSITDRASQTPLRKIFAALVGIHRRFIATRYRRGCPAVALQSRGLHYTAAGFVLRPVKRRLAPRPLPEIERAHHLHHASSAGRCSVRAGSPALP